MKQEDVAGTDSFPGNGTSFATPATAGLAACWLAYHGRDFLIAHYGHSKFIPRAFAWLLRNVAYNTPDRWNRKNFGPGMIDGGKLLRAPLPDKAALNGWPVKKHSLSSNVLGFLLRPLNREAVLEGVEGEEEEGWETTALVRRYGAELRYHLFDNPELASSILSGAFGSNGASLEAASNAAPAAITGLRAIASPSLARELTLAVNPSDDFLPQARRNRNDDADASAEMATAQPETPVAVPESPRPWRAAKSLLKLRDQVNAIAPNRRKDSDGTIGDASHQTRDSDHNPWVTDGNMGVVTALDITNDAAHGCDVNAIVEAIRSSVDSRIKYIIWNRRIANHEKIGSVAPWQWRKYKGKNPHTAHCHISVKSDRRSTTQPVTGQFSSALPASLTPDCL